MQNLNRIFKDFIWRIVEFYYNSSKDFFAQICGFFRMVFFIDFLNSVNHDLLRNRISYLGFFKIFCHCLNVKFNTNQKFWMHMLSIDIPNDKKSWIFIKLFSRTPWKYFICIILKNIVQRFLPSNRGFLLYFLRQYVSHYSI